MGFKQRYVSLKLCKCTKCDYEGHDADFENLVSGELIKGETPNLDSEPDIHSIMNKSLSVF